MTVYKYEEDAVCLGNIKDKFSVASYGVMSEDKKVSDEKKYAQVSRESIRFMGESVGLADLSDEITTVLAEDVNYRLREIAQNCGQFLRHAKRRKLTVDDFSKVLRWSNVEPIYGHNSAEPLPFHYCKEADVYYCDDREINVLELGVNSQMIERPGPSFVKTQWLAIEGIQKNTTTTQGNNGKRTCYKPIVSEELMSYYEQMTKAILGNDEELMKVALEDLCTNPKIAPLLPFLINFVSTGVKKVSHDLTQLTKLLYTVNSIICNQALYLEPKPYLQLLTQGLLYCILEPLAASINPTNDHWALRDYAARLLALISRLWTTPLNRLREEILISLRDIFADLTKPFSSHYGAIIGIIAFGPVAVEEHLLPYLSKYWPHLTSVTEDSLYSNAQVKADAQKVSGALLLAAHVVIDYHTHEFFQDGMTDCISRKEFTTESHIHEASFENVSSTNNCDQFLSVTTIKTELDVDCKGSKDLTSIVNRPINEVYCMLYECFGDSLSMRLPFVSVPGLYQPREEPFVNLFSSPDLLQTGEELLETFIVKEEEWQSISADDEHSYDDRDSMLSYEGETEPVPTNVNLRIKSTVSDPTLGIKLTIAKLPRSSNPPADNSSSWPSKRKKLSIKIKKEQLEPLEPDEPFVSTLNLKNRCIPIEFCFAGAMPIPQDKLKRNVILPPTQPLEGINLESRVHTLSLLMKRKGKLKSSAPMKWWASKLSSGNIFGML